MSRDEIFTKVQAVLVDALGVDEDEVTGLGHPGRPRPESIDFLDIMFRLEKMSCFLRAAGTVMADPNRLQQVVWNLLANAIKFTPSGGRVTLSLSRDGAMAVVSVSDTGEGIPSTLLPFIFDRFTQGDVSVTRPHGGLGLGLSIVRHIVELHGGQVRAASEGPGKGSAFTVQLPVRVSQRQ